MSEQITTPQDRPTPSKEAVYDEQIAPLMARIIETCKTHGIAMLASFSIPTEDDPGLNCFTNLPDETGKVPDHHTKAVRLIRPPAPAPVHVTTRHADGTATLAAFL